MRVVLDVLQTEDSFNYWNFLASDFNKLLKENSGFSLLAAPLRYPWYARPLDNSLGVFSSLEEEEFLYSFLVRVEGVYCGIACVRLLPVSVGLLPTITAVYLHDDYRGQGLFTEIIECVSKEFNSPAFLVEPTEALHNQYGGRNISHNCFCV